MRSRSNLSAAARATARWPRCTGSNVPPKRAILMRLSALPLPEGRLLGDPLHALRFLFCFASGDSLLSNRWRLLSIDAFTNTLESIAKRVLQFRNALGGHGGDLIDIETQLLGMLAKPCDLFRIGHIHL